MVRKQNWLRSQNYRLFFNIGNYSNIINNGSKQGGVSSFIAKQGTMY